MRRGLLLAVIVLVIALGGWRWRAAGRASSAPVRVPTARVTEGLLVVTLPVSGSLESAQEIAVRAEIDGTLVDIGPDNTAVKPGDFAFQLDTKDLVKQREDLAAALADAEEALSNQEATGETQLAQAAADAEGAQESLRLAQEKAQADVEQAKAQVKFVEGQAARAERELSRAQRLAKLNYIAGTRLRDAEKSYRQQQFALEQQRAQLADTEKRAEEQVKAQQTALTLAQNALETSTADNESHLEDSRLGVAGAQRRLDQVEKKIKQCTATAPTAGMMVVQVNDSNWPERRPYRLGDAVSSGGSPVKVFDPNKMQVRCNIGEMDILRVHQGQRAWVTTPSRADKRYRGRVALVEELAQTSDVWSGGSPGKKVFGVLVTMEEADPVNLRPGMTVDLEIELDSVRQAVVVPIRALFAEGKQRYVYRATGATGFTRVPVTAGTRNDLLVEVRGGVRVGDEVALERPPASPAPRGEVKR